MGVLTLKCRTTEKMFSTGIRVDEDTFRTLPDIAVRSRCPHCGLVHVWWPREATLANTTRIAMMKLSFPTRAPWHNLSWGPLLAARVRGQCCPRHARLDRRLDGHKVATQGIVAAMAQTAVPRAALAL